MPNLNYKAGTTKRQEYDKQYGTNGQNFNDLNQPDVDKFNSTKDAFTNGSSSTPNNGVLTTGNNDYNASTAQASALKKQTEENQKYGTTIFDTPNEFDKYSLNERWEPSFLQDDPTGRVLDNRRDTVRNEARQQQALAAASLGFKVNEVEKEQKSHRMFEAITLGGRAGGITNSGLIEGMRTAGTEFIEAVRADGQMSLAELKARHSSMIFEVDTATAQSLKEYIVDEQSKVKQRIYSAATGGWLASIDDVSLLAMARDADMDEVEALALKSSVQALLEAEDKEEAKRVIQEQVTKAYERVSPVGYDVSGSSVGGAQDENGIFRFGNALSRKWGAQCGGFANDALNLTGVNRMGHDISSKTDGISSGEPIQLGFFVEKTGYVDPSNGIEYGHTGVVESVSADGSTIEIVEYNRNNNEKKGRETWTLVGPYGKSSNGTVWKNSKGQTRNILGFGEGNLKVTESGEETIVTEVTTNNYKTVEEYVTTSDRDFPQIGSYETILKSKSGFSDKEIMALAGEAAKSGSLQNAMLTKVFNEQQVAIPQKLLDAQPRDKIEMAGQLLQMYGADMPPEQYAELANAGVIDPIVAMNYANKQEEKDAASKANEDYIKFKESEGLRLEEKNIDRAIQNDKLDYQASMAKEQNDNPTVVSNTYASEFSKVDFPTVENKLVDLESRIAHSDASSILNKAGGALGIEGKLPTIESQKEIDAIASELGLKKGLTFTQLTSAYKEMFSRDSKPDKEVLYDFYSVKVNNGDIKASEIYLPHLKIMVEGGQATSDMVVAYEKLSSKSLSGKEAYNKFMAGEELTDEETTAASSYLTLLNKQNQFVESGGGFSGQSGIDN